MQPKEKYLKGESGIDQVFAEQVRLIFSGVSYATLVTLTVGVTHDITDRYRMEEDLRNFSFAADAANRAKSQFLANMSHELRTPLNAIIGYSELLREEAEERGEASEMADLERIGSAGRHLLSLVNEVLDLSKVEAGDIRLDVSRHGSNLGPDNPGNMVFTVSDTGQGIAPDQVEAAFTAFEQTDSSRNGTRGGTGLGLPLSRHFCAMMGGTISVESELGRGSTFTVRLPAEIGVGALPGLA